MECALFADIRRKYIKKYYWIRPSMFKVVNLINSDNRTTIKNLGIYKGHPIKSETDFKI